MVTSSSAETAPKHPPALRLDRAGRILELDPGWDHRLRHHGFDRHMDFFILAASELRGREIWELLDPKRHGAWRRWLEGLEIDGPPAAIDDRVLRRLHARPSRDGFWIRLDTTAEAALTECLRQPLFQLERGRLRGLNEAAHILLESAGESRDLRRFEAWLGARHAPLRLVALPEIRLGGKPLFGLRPPFPHGQASFALLARAFRSTLHDLSNPLAALRMMVELLERTKGPGSSATRPQVVSYLDQAIVGVHRLRSLAHADASIEELCATEELAKAVELVRSELRRRELEVRVTTTGDGVLVAGASTFRLLVTAGLLASSSRAAAGQTLHLELTSFEASHTLTCHLEHAAPSAGVLPAPAAEIELLRRLAQACDGRLHVAPGDRRSGSLDWRIDFGDEPM